MPKTGRRPCRSPRPASVTRLRPIIRDTARKDKAARQAAADRKGTSRRVAIRVSTVAPLIDGFLGVPRARRSGKCNALAIPSCMGSSPREAIRGQPSLAATSMLGNVPAHGDQDARRRLLWHPPSSRSAGTLQSIPPDTAGLPERPMTRRGPIAAAGAPPGALLSAFTGRPYEGTSLRFNKLSSLLPLYVRIVLDRRLPPWASYPQ